MNGTYPKYQIIKHFTDTDLYKLTMCCAVINCFPRAQVVYEFIDRNNTIYPKGFDKAFRQQLYYLQNVIITDEEIEFMKRKCYYIPNWFYTYLKGYRYNTQNVFVKQDKEGHLTVRYKGDWCDVILLEVQILAIISELLHYYNGELFNLKYKEYRMKAYEKGRKLIENGLKFSDFGTRRRMSYHMQKSVVEGLKMADMEAKEYTNEGFGELVGTSNVYLAMKYDLTPIGTMAHEFIMAIAAMYGVQEANHIAMQKWNDTFHGALGLFLYDTYTFEAFSNNFSEDMARLFSGLRVDSGDNFEQLQLIKDKYKSLRIDPSSKQIVFSNALTVDEAINIHKHVDGSMQDSYGIGTHFTCDVEGVKPLNIVIKLTKASITENRKMNKTCKMSEDKGKYTGDEDTVHIFKTLLHLKD